MWNRDLRQVRTLSGSSFFGRCPRSSCTCTSRAPSNPSWSSPWPQRNGVALPYRHVGGAPRRLPVHRPAVLPRPLLRGARPCCSTEEDFYDLTRAYLRRAAGRRRPARRGLLRPPDPHRPGRPLRHGHRGHRRGRWSEGERAWASTTRLILCFLRDRQPESAWETLRRRPAPIGTGSPRSAWTRRRWATHRSCSRDVFAAAPGRRAAARWPTPARKARRRTSGRPSTCSAWSASTTACAAWRTRSWWSAWSPERVPLTVCPLSNVRLRRRSTTLDGAQPAATCSTPA